MQSEIGIIITNRDRPDPLSVCLRSLSAQTLQPAWVVIADLGSSAEGAGALEELARSFMISYIQISYFEKWNQALAFNTALRHMPAVGHVIQLDADLILHPYLLEFTKRGLQSVDAMCCVPSYVDVREVPFDYDGSAVSFGRLLSKAYGGNRLSRGGYVALPREWLLANRSFDEAYEGWGFEDADLWWRTEQQLTTYEEISGSFIIHQSHPRQDGATDPVGNSNWLRYQRRIKSIPLQVNPREFGGAAVSRKLIRYGILSAPEPRDLYAPLVPVQVRTRQGDKLRPPQNSDVTSSTEISPGRLEELLQEECNWPPASITVIIHVGDDEQDMVGATLNSLAAQRVSPDLVILTGRVAQSETASWRSSYAPHFQIGDALDADEANSLFARAREPSVANEYVLEMSGGLLLHPRALELLSAIERVEPSLLSGPVHTLPPAARELRLIEGVPLQAWAAIAHLEARDLDSWCFFPLMSTEDHSAWREASTAPDMFERGRLRPELAKRNLSRDVVLFLQCPRKVDLLEVYG